MQELLQKAQGKINELWEKTEKKDRIRFFIILVIGLAVIIASVIFLSRVEYSVLYRDMTPTQAGEVLGLLKEMGVDAKAEGTGTILVNARDRDRIAMELASKGYPKGGFTYDTFAAGSGFGTTDYEKQMYSIFQLQEWLRETLMQMDKVRDASVIIAKPDKSVVLKSEVVPVTASVVLTLKEGTALTPDQVDAVVHVVSSAVEGLSPENVSVTDNFLNRLNAPEEDEIATATSNYQMQKIFERDLAANVLSLLVPIFGADNVRVAANVTLNFDDINTEEIVFSPVVDDEGIAVSLKEIKENAIGGRIAEGVAGVDENGGAPIYPDVTEDTSRYSNYTREINYEVNQKVTQIKQAKGTVKDVSVSVAVNNKILVEGDPSANAESISRLVGSVIGISPEDQKDSIEVSFMAFSGLDMQNEAQRKIMEMRKQENLFAFLKTMAIYLIIGITIIVIVLNIIGLLRKDKRAEAVDMALGAMDGDEAELEELQRLAELASGEEISIGKSRERELVENFVEKSPELAANLIRNWLSEERHRG